MTACDFDWMVSNHAVWGWNAPVNASVSGVSLLQLYPFLATIFPLFPQKRLILRLLIHRSHQSKLPILSEIPWRKSLWSQFKVLTAGRLGTRRKVAESSSRLYGLSNVMVSLSLSNRPSLKTLAFASSDSPKSSIKIPYPERNTEEKKPMVTV